MNHDYASTGCTGHLNASRVRNVKPRHEHTQQSNKRRAANRPHVVAYRYGDPRRTVVAAMIERKTKPVVKTNMQAIEQNLMTTQTEIRDSFWAAFPEYQPQFKAIPYTQNGKRLYRRKTQNDYSATIRSLFVEYVDHLARNGEISEVLATRATL